MKRLRTVAFLAAALCTGVYAANEIIALGWSWADINGTRYVAGTHSLPGGWTFQIVDTNASKVTANAAASRKGNQLGTAANTQIGQVNYKYRLRTDGTVPSNPTTIVQYTLICTATAGAEVHVTGGNREGYGTAAILAAAARAFANDTNPGPNRQTDGPTYLRGQMRFRNANWVADGGSWKKFEPPAFGFMQDAMTDAKNPTSAGNYLVVEASASSVGKFYVSSFSNESAGPREVLSGSMDSFLTYLNAHIFNDNGVPIEDWLVSVDDLGAFSLQLEAQDYPKGNYRIYFYAHRKSLRKRMDIEWDPDTGLSGIAVELKYGDLNGDGYISQAEIDFIYSCIGMTNQNWLEWRRGVLVGQGYLDPKDADINNDGAVTMADYNLAYPNVGSYGDQEEVTLLSLIAKLKGKHEPVASSPVARR